MSLIDQVKDRASKVMAAGSAQVIDLRDDRAPRGDTPKPARLPGGPAVTLAERAGLACSPPAGGAVGIGVDQVDAG